MRIITISREFGSGGRELGKQLANELGYDYYDKQIISAIASNKGMDEEYVERTIDQHRWQNVPLTYYQSVAGLPVDSTHTDLLLERKRVIEEIAKRGKNCVIVGRNADVLLQEYNPFNIFVCADMETKIRRCMEREDDERCKSIKDIEREINRIDKNRAQTRGLITNSSWGDKSEYHLTLNTSSWDIKALTQAVAEFVKRWFESTNK
ncbi:MAG TPA: cytidylate kinase-like family protein [Dysgonamonadaceae bacterium]|nr:cytidylate kinase-like family protein [Dysgonamonadaceae bacterium]